MAASSNYFKTLFDLSVGEGQKGEIIIKEVDGSVKINQLLIFVTLVASP